MIFVALGETDSVGASCHYLDIEGTGLVLDAGTDPEEDGPDSLPRFDVVRAHDDWYMDHVLVTHAHHDHIGAVPVLLEWFPQALVHMTRATRQLADILLPASARLQKRKLREGSSQFDPLFDEEQLEMYSYLYLTHELGTTFDVAGPHGTAPVRAEFFSAGHILGSAGVLLTFAENGEDRRVFYTSDTNMRSQSIIPGGDYPEEPVDTLILESTMGDDEEAEQTTRRLEEQKLGDAIERTIGRGGTVLIPVFALGRAQEVLAIVDRFKKQGRVPEETPVYTAGIMRAIASLYDQTRFATPRVDPSFQVYNVEQRRLPRSEAATMNALSEPSIHVVTSGMMFERTASNRIAQELVEDEKHAILRVGYAVETSPAHRLLEAAEQGKGAEVVISEDRGPQEVHCDVERFFLSGHSHRRDLIQIVERLQPERVILVHGEGTAKQWMEDTINKFYPEVEVLRPPYGEPIEV